MELFIHRMLLHSPFCPNSPCNPGGPGGPGAPFSMSQSSAPTVQPCQSTNTHTHKACLHIYGYMDTHFRYMYPVVHFLMVIENQKRRHTRLSPWARGSWHSWLSWGSEKRLSCHAPVSFLASVSLLTPLSTRPFKVPT